MGLPSGILWAQSNEVKDDGNIYFDYDEAVRRFWGYLPTKAQWEELKDNCRWTWNGSGYNVVGLNDNSIVLPATGYRYCNGSVDRVGSGGDYWTSSPNGSDDAWCLHFYSGTVNMNYNY